MQSSPPREVCIKGSGSGQVFKFPLSNQGLQSFGSVKEMKETYIQLFDKQYGNSSSIKWSFYFVRSRFWKETNRKYREKMEQIWKMRCNVCTSVIVYGKRQGFMEYYLLKINYYHMHATGINQYLAHLRNHDKFRYVVGRLQTNQLSPHCSDQAAIIDFIANLPTNLHKTTMYWVVKKYFSVSEASFFRLLSKVNQKYQISFAKLVNNLTHQGCQIAYLPSHLLHAHDPLQAHEQRLHAEQLRDKKNPHLPNLLLIVSPQMKQEYLSFGQWVGFDLTFSVIRERTEQNGEYMLGIFGGSNHSKKIVVFGLAVTNSQSAFAYSFLFQHFFRMMGSVPEIIITDEEKAIHHSLRQLKTAGIFTGHHLFDMFHMLRKFRKRSYDSQTFQLLRKLIHAKDRAQYRHLLRTLQNNVVNDKELELIRGFDLNAEQYCYSQIPPKFTGIGVSNNVNEFFHSLIKNEIRTATKMTKAIQIVLELIERRNEASHKPIVTQHSIQTFLNMPFVKHFKSSVSEKAYDYMLREVSQGATLKIMTLKEEMTRNLIKSQGKLHEVHFLSRRHFYLQSEFGIHLVSYQRSQNSKQRKDQSNQQPKDEKSSRQIHDEGRWSCKCEHSQRCGYPCSHLSRILIALNLSFLPHIHPRWVLDPVAVQARLQDGQSNLKLKKTYQKIIHRYEDVRAEHFDIDGYKRSKNREDRSERERKEESVRMSSRLDDGKSLLSDETKDITHSQFGEDQDSVVSRDVEYDLINLLDDPDEGKHPGLGGLRCLGETKIKKSGKGKPPLSKLPK